MLSTILQPYSQGQGNARESDVSELALASMGFDVRHLRFYAWLVEHGREPVVDDSTPLSIRRYAASDPS